MLAIAVAVRIDVYGVIYAVALGVLFIFPRELTCLFLPLYLLVHGGLLALQYFFLLGAPPSVCYNKPDSTGTCLLHVFSPHHIHKRLISLCDFMLG